jgi:transmembrane sensor
MDFDEHDDVAERARAWVVRLASGGMSADELAALKTWLAAAPAHGEAFAAARALWQGLGPLEATFARLEPGDRLAAPAVPNAPKARSGRAWRRGSLCRRALLPAAVALAVCLLLAVFAPQVATRLQADYVSGSDGVLVVALSDGSRVTLDRNSAIAVEFTAQRRTVEVLAGEAFFEVRKDPARPFDVVAGDGVSEAVGTAYAVRVGDGGARVAVTEGRVSVRLGGDPAHAQTLGAGKGLCYGADGSFGEPFALDGARALAWRDGKVVFAGRPLAEAIAELDRYRPGRILLWGKDQDLRPVSGVIDLDRLDEGLQALAATHGLTVVTLGPFLTVLR